MQYAVRSSGTWGVVTGIVLVLIASSSLGCGAHSPNDNSPGTQNDPGTQQVLFVGNQEPNTVSAYKIGNDGSLAAVSASPFPVGGNTLIANPNGKVLFSFGLNTDTLELNTDRIARDGSLQMSSRIADNTLAGVRAINPSGTALYVSSINAAEDNWGWKVYSIQPDGTLQLNSGIIDQTSGRLTFTQDGAAAFSAYCYFLIPNIEHFSVAPDGSLTNTRNQITTNIPFGECPNAVAVTKAGDMLAAPWSDATSSDPTQDFITLFSINPETHDLEPPAGSMFPASGAGQDAIFDPSGKFLITAQNNGVGVYKVGLDSLTEVSGSPFGGAAMNRVMLTPLGKFVVAISGASGKIFVFAFNSSTGAIVQAPGSPVSTSSPYDLAIIQQ